MKKSNLSKLLLLLLIFIALEFSISILKDQKKLPESVQINNKNYPLGKRWAGRKINFLKIPIFDFQTKEFTQRKYIFRKNKRVWLRTKTLKQLQLMLKDAKKEGLPFQISSGYRSVERQKKIVLRRLKEGQSIKRIFHSVAPPGYSTHHTGNSIDFYPASFDFAKTKTYQWLKKNGADYGFIETYPNLKSNPIMWEPWHWQYSPTLFFIF